MKKEKVVTMDILTFAVIGMIIAGLASAVYISDRIDRWFENLETEVYD